MQAPPNILPSNWVKDCRDNARGLRSRPQASPRLRASPAGRPQGQPSTDPGFTPASGAAALGMTLLSTILSIFVLFTTPDVCPSRAAPASRAAVRPDQPRRYDGQRSATQSAGTRRGGRAREGPDDARAQPSHQKQSRDGRIGPGAADVRAQRASQARQAFATAVARIHVIPIARNHLMPRDGHSAIDMKEA